MGSRRTEALAKAPYALSYFSLFAIYGVASPYLQLLIRGLGYGPAAVGLFLGLFEVVGIAGPLVLARLADKKGKSKPFLLACAIFTCLPLAPLVLLEGPFVTALCLAILALGMKSMVPIMDSTVIAVTASRKGWDYGRLRAAGSVGFVAIALTLQLIPGFDRSPPERIALWIGGAALAFGFCLFLLPEGSKAAASSALSAAAAAPSDNSAAPSDSAAARATAAAPARPASGERRGSTGVFILGLLVIGFGRLALAPVNSFLSLYLVDEVKWDAVGGMWAIAALSEIPLLIFSSRIIAKLGPMGSCAVGTGAIALRLAIYALFPSPAGVVAAQLLHSLCFGLLYPAGVAFVALMVPPERRTEGMALYIGLAVGLPTVAGSALGGIVVEAWGYRALFGSFIVFALAGIALYLAERRRFARV
jgi:PPP family 3-phenylpropionic acid transporter